MRFWIHLLIAAVAAAAAAFALEKLGFATQVFSDARLLAQLAAVTVLGAALPDVDEPKTRQFRVVAAALAIGVFAVARDALAQRFPKSSSVENAAYAFAAAFAALGLLYVFKPRHRGITHSLAALAVFAAVVFALAQSALVAGFAGLAFATHLLADGEVKLF